MASRSESGERNLEMAEDLAPQTADDFVAMALGSVAQGQDPKRTGLSLARRLRDKGFSLEETLIIGRSTYVPRCRLANVTDETSPYTNAEWEEAARAVYSETPPAEWPDRRADSAFLSQATPPKPVENPNRNERRRSEREQAQSLSSDAVDEILAGLQLICADGDVHELRAINYRRNGRMASIVRGYFDDRLLMARAASEMSGFAEGIYLTLNPVNCDLLARCANRLDYSAKHATTDEQIVSRRWLLVDIDPVRISGISSTDEEHAAALARAEQIRQWLMEERNWPAPIFASSGNGAHLLSRLNLPNDAASTQLVKSALASLALRFSDGKVKVDPTTYNAARLSKVYGTRACKGDNVPPRPHRVARVQESIQ